MSFRWDYMVALKTHLATEITPANGYTHDLSGTDVVTNHVKSIEDRMSDPVGDVTVQIQEGREVHQRIEASPDTLTEVEFETLLSLLVRGDETDELARKRLNDLLADINLGLHKNPTVTSTVRRCRVAQVDEPVYDPNEGAAHVLVRLLAMYHYTAGTDI